MTVGVAIRVPGAGAVLACDGRYSSDETGEVYSDGLKKWGVYGSSVAIWAGCAGGLVLDLEESPPRNWRELRKAIKDASADHEERGYDLLVYDRSKDRLIHTGSQGDAALANGHAVIGCGGPLALGVLDAAKPPTSLDAAAKLALRAVKIACRRNAFCGGRVRVLIVHGRRGEIVVR